MAADTPGTFSKASSMHQKQPPAKIAISSLPSFDVVCAAAAEIPASSRTGTNQEKSLGNLGMRAGLFRVRGAAYAGARSGTNLSATPFMQ
jgi:hypothetical protein